MTETQNNLITNHLNKLATLKKDGHTEELNTELAHTNNYLEQKGIKEHVGKALVISADTLAVLVEAAKGNQNEVANLVTEDGLHFPGRSIVTLLDSAIAESESAIKSLTRESVHKNIYQLENNFEVIGHVTLNDIAYVASEMEIEDVEPKPSTLTTEQVNNIVTNVIGSPFEDIRENFDYLGDGYGIRKAIEPYIRKQIRKELENTEK